MLKSFHPTSSKKWRSLFVPKILAYVHISRNVHSRVWKPRKILCQKDQTSTVFLSEGMAITINNSDRRIANTGLRAANRFLLVPQVYPAVVMKLLPRQRGICAGVRKSPTIEGGGAHKNSTKQHHYGAREGVRRAFEVVPTMDL
jgi:hypothetical protein